MSTLGHRIICPSGETCLHSDIRILMSEVDTFLHSDILSYSEGDMFLPLGHYDTNV